MCNRFKHQGKPIFRLALALIVVFVGRLPNVFPILQNPHNLPIRAFRAEKIKIVSVVCCAFQMAMGNPLRAMISSPIVEFGHKSLLSSK
jgi:hypothetical protein